MSIIVNKSLKIGRKKKVEGTEADQYHLFPCVNLHQLVKLSHFAN